MQPFFSIFGLSVPAYGAMMLCGLCLGVGLVMLRRKRFSLARDDTFYLAFLAVAGALLGAKLLYALTKLPDIFAYWDFFVEHPDALFAELGGGLVFYGGVIGAFLLCAWYMRRFKISPRPVLDLFAPAIPLAHAAGRVGCFLAGCCYGKPAGWGVTFSVAIPPEANGVPRIPVALFEAAGDILICLALLLYQTRPRKQGRSFALYLLLYAPLRFALEFFRGDSARGVLWVFSTSQWLSFGFLAGGLYFLLRQGKEKGI